MQGPRLTHDEQYDGPFNPNTPPPKYGAQRYHLLLRNEKGQIVEGPRRQRVEPRRLNKRPVTYISFNSERLTAKRALVKYPKLRKHLLGLKTLKAGTLQAKLRKSRRVRIHTTQ